MTSDQFLLLKIFPCRVKTQRVMAWCSLTKTVKKEGKSLNQNSYCTTNFLLSFLLSRKEGRHWWWRTHPSIFWFQQSTRFLQKGKNSNCQRKIYFIPSISYIIISCYLAHTYFTLVEMDGPLHDSHPLSSSFFCWFNFSPIFSTQVRRHM